MTGGTISGNRAEHSSGFGMGGGVNAARYSSFIKTGGIIYGNDAGDNSNIADINPYNNIGHAVAFISQQNNGWTRNATLGENDNLSSESSAGWSILN